MEYIIIGSIALAVFIFLFTIIKVEKLRNRANALFLEAEKKIEVGHMEYVCTNLYAYIPNIVKLFVNEELFTNIIQMIYNNTREVARDLLDNGKLDKSSKEEK